jgi:hypothetical protein
VKQIYKIAFCGKMGAGKTTAALQLTGIMQDRFGDDAYCCVIKFGQPIYGALAVLHRRTKERTFMQRFGDLARREFGDDVFERIFQENVEAFVARKVPELSADHILLMTDDVRFLGEYGLVKQLGFTVVKIDAAEAAREARAGETFQNLQHRSEVEQEAFVPDFVIDNDVSEPHMMAFESELANLLDVIQEQTNADD